MNENGIKKDETRVLAVLTLDKPGVLERIAGVIRRRGCNIYSLTVGPSEVPGYSRFTILVSGVDSVLLQSIAQQIEKLIDVIRSEDITDQRLVMSELALLKLEASPDQLNKILGVLGPHRVRVLDTRESMIVLEATGDAREIDSVVAILRGLGLTIVKRSGAIAVITGKTHPEFATPQFVVGVRSDP